MHINNVHKIKTDKVDMFVITKALMIPDSLRFITLKNLDHIELKKTLTPNTTTSIHMTHLL